MDEKEAIFKVLRAEKYTKIRGTTEMKSYELENISVLKKIYNSSKDKESIISLLKENINMHWYLFYLNFEFLIRIKRIDDAFEGLFELLKNIKTIYEREQIAIYCMYRLYYLTYTTNDVRFSSKEIEDTLNYLEHLKKIILTEDPTNHLGNLIYEIIKTLELKSVEIIEEFYKKELLEEDAKEVVEKVKKLGLGEEIALMFEELRENYYETTDDIKANIFTSKIRDAFSEIIKKIALEIAKKESKNIKKDDGICREYLFKEGIISEEEKKFISSFYSLLSVTAVHHLITPKEYYRMSLNMAYEISLIILYKYEAYKKIPT